MQTEVNSYFFSIAGLVFNIHMPYRIRITENFIPFLVNEEKKCIHVYINEVKKIHLNKEKLLSTQIPFSVYEDENGHFRIFHDHKENDREYAVGRILSADKEVINYLAENRKFFNESNNTFSHIAFEELLIRNNAVILHASFINTEYGAVLFSGPSGIGKSTQAELWCKYRNAEQINGDKPILKKDMDTWKAYGSPYAGSSKCWINKSSQVAVIVLLEQGNRCHIKKMRKKEAFCKVYEGLVVNSWNSAYVEKIATLVESIIEEVPVYHMTCTPDENAVDMLEGVLKGKKRDEYQRNSL